MSLRADIETSTITARKRAKKKKKIRSAGMMGDLFDKLTGKKTKKKIDSILDQTPERLREEREAEEADS